MHIYRVVEDHQGRPNLVSAPVTKATKTRLYVADRPAVSRYRTFVNRDDPAIGLSPKEAVGRYCDQLSQEVTVLRQTIAWNNRLIDEAGRLVE